ncbi:hypothetical protein C8J57DRAFT_1213307 [Mycena rebaudengoi]|nr:hypothetical protein C8J57DRAFT_1213307 [Mycena rebaudengoi]
MAFYTGLENQPAQSKLKVCSEWSCVPYGKTSHLDNWVDQVVAKLPNILKLESSAVIQSSSATAYKSATHLMRAGRVVAGLDILLTIRKPVSAEPNPSCEVLSDGCLRNSSFFTSSNLKVSSDPGIIMPANDKNQLIYGKDRKVH